MLINKQKLKLLILVLIQTNIVSAASVPTPITVASGTTTTINAADTASHAAATPAATVNSGTLTVDGTIENNGGTAVELDVGSTLTINGTARTNSAHNVITTTNTGTGAITINLGPNAVIERDSGNGGDYALDLDATTTSGNTVTVNSSGATIRGGIDTHNACTINLGQNSTSAGTIAGNIDMHHPHHGTFRIYKDFTTGGSISNVRFFHIQGPAVFDVRHTLSNIDNFYIKGGSTVRYDGNAQASNKMQFSSGSAKVIINGSSTGTISTSFQNQYLQTGSTIEVNNNQILAFSNPFVTNYRGTLTLNSGSFTSTHASGGADFLATAVINLNGGTITAPTVTTNNSTQVNITANSSIVAATGYTANGVILKYTPISATSVPLLTLNSASQVDFTNSTIQVDYSSKKLRGGTYTLATNTHAAGITGGGSATITFPTPDDRITSSALSMTGGNNLILTIVRSSIQDVLKSNSPSSTGVTNSISALSKNNPQIGEIEDAIFDLSSEAREYAANQLAPEINGASTSSAISAGQSVSRVALDRLAALRDTNTVTTGYVAGDINNDSAIWYKVFGGEIQQNKRKNVAGYDASLGGIAIGVDQAFANSTTAGLGFSIANTHIKSRLFNAPNTTNIVSYQGIAYGSFDKNNLFVDGAVNYANNRYVGNRIFKFGTIDRKALFKHHGHQFGIVLESGYKLYSKGFNLKPIIDLSYIHSSKNPYTENVAESSDLGLKFDRSKTTKIDGGIGLKISKKFKTTNKSWTPNLHLRIIHDFKGARQTSVSRFVGGGAAFATTGPRPARTALNVGVGIKILSGDNCELSAKYELEGKEHYLSYNGSFSARYMF